MANQNSSGKINIKFDLGTCFEWKLIFNHHIQYNCDDLLKMLEYIKRDTMEFFNIEAF